MKTKNCIVASTTTFRLGDALRQRPTTKLFCVSTPRLTLIWEPRKKE